MPGLDALPLAASASNLLAARELMAFTLAFHIVLASLGVALPAMIAGATRREARKRAEDLLGQLGLAERLFEPVVAPEQLSPGDEARRAE